MSLRTTHSKALQLRNESNSALHDVPPDAVPPSWETRRRGLEVCLRMRLHRVDFNENGFLNFEQQDVARRGAQSTWIPGCDYLSYANIKVCLYWSDSYQPIFEVNGKAASHILILRTGQIEKNANLCFGHQDVARRGAKMLVRSNSHSSLKRPNLTTLPEPSSFQQRLKSKSGESMVGSESHNARQSPAKAIERVDAQRDRNTLKPNATLMANRTTWPHSDTDGDSDLRNLNVNSAGWFPRFELKKFNIPSSRPAAVFSRHRRRQRCHLQRRRLPHDMRRSLHEPASHEMLREGSLLLNYLAMRPFDLVTFPPSRYAGPDFSKIWVLTIHHEKNEYIRQYRFFLRWFNGPR
ncbi:hypothetical protein CPB85DRAFT_1263400 [Mucidula mucida]|nr:hypothetical protein CPB85DRAFT_1263400 [Mucidula mucida]